MATNQVENRTQRGLGTSDTISLTEQFPAAPNDFEPDRFINNLLDSVVTENPILGAFDMNYGGAPNILDDAIQNDPGIVGYVPNPTPPGPGDTNPNNKGPAPETNFPPDPTSLVNGNASSTSPSSTSPKIAEQKFNELIFGKSYGIG